MYITELIRFCSFALLQQELCAGFEVLEETLVLRLEGGAEYYVPVFARYASPAFGTPLALLSANRGSEVYHGEGSDLCSCD